MDRDQGAVLPPVTKWFALAKQKPWVPGVYEVQSRYPRRGYLSYWSFWDGSRFLGTTFLVEHAEVFGKSFGPTRDSITRWRGLSADPARTGLGAMAEITSETLQLIAQPTPKLIHATSLYHDGPDVTFMVDFTSAGRMALDALGQNRSLILKDAIEAALRGAGHG